MIHKDRVYAGVSRDVGHETERHVIEYLKKHLSGSWALAHNLLLPAKYRNSTPDETDLVLIGPPGVYSIELKWWEGVISGAFQDGWVYFTKRGFAPESRRNPIKTANDKKNILLSTLRDCMNERMPPVMGGVIFPPESKCQIKITPPPFEINFPLLNLDQVADFFKRAEDEAGQRLRGTKSLRLNEEQIDRIFNIFRGARDTLSTDTERHVGSYVLMQPLHKQENEHYIPYLAYNAYVSVTDTVLIKELKLDEHMPASEYEELKEKLLREARALFVLRGHPNILQTFGPFSHAGKLYVAYEWFNGPTLANIVDDIDYEPVDYLKNIMIPVLDAIRAAHANKIVHRNLTPDCIVVSLDDSVKITDFALARFFQGQTIHNWTAAKVSAYTAPETLTSNSKEVHFDPRSDIYSLGAICYEIVTGSPPDPPHKRKSDELSFKSRNPSVPEKIKKVIQKAMSLAPGRRYQTTEDMVQALQEALV
ncbi:MAG: serine/threonine protein kinase [Anaerolineae bacterium]|nr:serine/threonine protein kinase [Anaerolineae bacterium]